MELEGLGVPTVTFVTSRFASLAEALMKGRGAACPFVVFPHTVETMSPEEVRALVDKAFPEVVSKLTEPIKMAVAP